MRKRSNALGANSIDTTTTEPPSLPVSVGVVPDSIKRIADVERTRDAERDRVAALAARRAELARAHGARVVRELLDAVRRDLAAFESSLRPVMHDTSSLDVSDGGEGFVLRKETAPLVTLTVLAAPGDRDHRVRLCLRAAERPAAREDRLELVLVADRRGPAGEAPQDRTDVHDSRCAVGVPARPGADGPSALDAAHVPCGKTPC